MKSEFVISGIGGQGVLFLTKLLSLIADESNLPFIGSEIHGMSQRGGSVVSHLRIGDFLCPLVRRGNADYLLALEENEAYRNIHFLKPGGRVYVNTSNKKFPLDSHKILLDKYNIEVIKINANFIASSIDAPGSSNLILLGAYIALEDNIFTRNIAEKAIARIGKKEAFEKNMKAFIEGIKAGENIKKSIIEVK